MDLRSLNKAELHVHLEGSVTPETLQEIEPALSLDEIRSHYEYENFLGFLQSYKWVNLHLKAPEHFGLITRRLLEDLARQGARYAEINVSAGVVLWRGMELAPVFDAIAGAAADGPIPVRFIFDAVRQFGLEHVWSVARAAVGLKDRGVVGFGVGGDEAGGPIELFREVFDYARANGLRLAPHAGETVGPESVWAALECGAERIGHGIRSIEDPVLVKHLRDRRIPLEVSISSNVCTGAVRSLKEHPVRKLYDAGVPIVLNTDDPPMFHTTLLREYEIARDEFGFAEGDLRAVAENGFRFAFGPVAEFSFPE
ncbi:adenosine deaminase [uncultured Paludibaculum sp.]|uniref:adenosine deaminase n=1 Tax=uncultured Paludibaculum sp. TaxID=1765020 RepID=UPI002AAA7C1A|nr:adenosine deaminase [uncultured Paludibaculum sp.]